MTISEAILKIVKKWRVYDQFIVEVKAVLNKKNIYRSSQSIDREIRRLVNLGTLEARKVKGKTYKEFRLK